MINIPRFKRVVVPLALSLMTVTFAAPQERTPSGEIYRELLPFVGLKGVQLEIHGLGGFVWNIRPPAVGAPETEITGLSRTEHKQLFDAIKADATESLRLAGIPLMKAGSANEEPPCLVLTVSTYRFRPDAISAEVRIELMQAARLLRDPGTVVWSSTWADKASNLFVDSATLTTWLRQATRGQLNQFVQLYVRANRKAG